MLIYPVFIPQWGCPQQCIYCNQSKITDSKGFDPGELVPQLEAFVSYNKDKDKQIAFYGGSFTALDIASRQRVLEHFLPIIDARTSFRISTRPDCIDQDVLQWCKAYKIQTIELGIQDFSDRVLNASGRSYTSDIAYAACSLVMDSGIELGVQLMPGLPGWDVDSLAFNHYSLEQLRPALLRIYPLIVISGTALETLYRNKKYIPLSMETAINQCADYTALTKQTGTKIIKLGLPSNLNPSEVVAGPYHPAFGEFVRAELLVREIEATYKPGAKIVLDKKKMSLLMGHERKFYNILCKRIDSCTPDISYI